METLENILFALENQLKEINLSVKLTFGNTNLMKQQLRHIINCQDNLNIIKVNLHELLQSTEQNSHFPIIPAALGALLTLIGGTTSQFGIDLTLAAVQQHSNNQDKRKDIHQRCIHLNKKIEDAIQNCENLKFVADKAFANYSLMKYLSKKQKLKNFIQTVGNILLWLLFYICITIFICSILLFFYSKFWLSIGTFLLGIITLICVGKLADYISKNDDNWKTLLIEIAKTDHYK